MQTRLTVESATWWIVVSRKSIGKISRGKCCTIQKDLFFFENLFSVDYDFLIMSLFRILGENDTSYLDI